VDDSGSLTSRGRMPGTLALAALSIALLVGCATTEPPRLPASPKVNTGEITKSVAQARGLTWKQEISLAPAAAKLPAFGADEYNGAPIAAVEQSYKAIGLLAAADDLKKSLAEFLRLDSLIGYDASRGIATWSPAAAQLGAMVAKNDPENGQNVAAVFAAMEALQEQHFQWRAALTRQNVEDRRAAFTAVAVGDAILTFATRGTRTEPPKLELSDTLAGALERLGGNLPEFLRRRLIFPYRHGSRFVYWAFKANGWRGVNGIYADPPLSTAEILHPEKYFVEREAPLRLFPPQLLRSFKQPAVIEQTFGEDAIAGLLTGARPAQGAEKIAAGWRGDQLFHFVETGRSVTAWLTAWRTDKDADEFLRAYWAVLQVRHGVRFEMADARAPALAESRERGWLLQRIGDVVLLLSSSPSSNLPELGAETWKDLEIEREKIELRFESARAATQLSLTSR
jgi:hypothetical protein